MKEKDEPQRRQANSQQRSTWQTDLPPPLSRMFLVAAGVDEWTVAERAWLAERPKFIAFQADLSAAIKKLAITELLTSEQVIRFSKNREWAPFEERLARLVESTDSGNSLPNTEHADRIGRNRDKNPRSMD